MASAELRKRGRPVKFESPRGTLTIRLRDEIRGELQALADKHGRSLSEEIEYRLQRSFDQEALVRELAKELRAA